MFERRLKILLAFLGLVTLTLMLRAGQVQLLERQKWADAAAELTKVPHFVETTRGTIRDRTGRALAEDDPCIDACVDYRAIALSEPGAADDDMVTLWLHDQAMAELTARMGDEFTGAKTSKRKQMVKDEMPAVREKIAGMWGELAKVSGQTPEQIDEIRHGIFQRVELRKRYVWLQNFEKALAKWKGTTRPSSWYDRWMDSGADAPDVDKYEANVAEETEAHVILPAIDVETANELTRRQEDFPGLVLRMSHHRVYPFARTACHIVGYLSPVTAGDAAGDTQEDPLRKYFPNDLIGKGGVEAMCEQTLRGTRGQTITQAGSDKVISSTEAVPGRDVKLTIDVELEQEIEEAFAAHRTYVDSSNNTTFDREDQHGAAVVIDLKNGDVLAMVSNPGYDPNMLQQDYARLAVDDLNLPLIDRATQEAQPPGSSVKPMMGLAALTDGIITATTTIECTGYLVLDGVKYNQGKCWTMREFGYLGPLAVHHQIPTADPHPTGFLNVTDAIQRSCNVFFETVADRMGMVRQRYWYQRFGLGEKTGIGLPEVAGRVPNPAHIPRALLRVDTWFSGIGEGEVTATPIQMANVAATIARDGVWMKPRLVDDGEEADKPVNLGFSAENMALVKLGMYRVVNTRAGTGPMPGDADDPVRALPVAAKTGTAQVVPITIPVRDDNGQVVVDEHGRQKRQAILPGEPGTELWYGTGKDSSQLAHAWYIGYAPADHPQIAFCVFVEYGEAGGTVAGGIAHDVLLACMKHGYLKGSGQ